MMVARKPRKQDVIAPIAVYKEVFPRKAFLPEARPGKQGARGRIPWLARGLNTVKAKLFKRIGDDSANSGKPETAAQEWLADPIAYCCRLRGMTTNITKGNAADKTIAFLVKDVKYCAGARPILSVIGLQPQPERVTRRLLGFPVRLPARQMGAALPTKPGPFLVVIGVGRSQINRTGAQERRLFRDPAKIKAQQGNTQDALPRRCAAPALRPVTCLDYQAPATSP